MLMFFLIFLASGIDNFFHPLSLSLGLWILFLFNIRNFTHGTNCLIIPYTLLALSFVIGFMYIILFIYMNELSFSNNILFSYNDTINKLFFTRFLEDQERDDLQIAGLVKGREPADLFYSIVQVICWFGLFFITISQKVTNKSNFLNKLLLGGALFFVFSWCLDLIFLVSHKPEILDEGNFHGITSEPYRHAELALIYFVLFMTKVLINRHYKSNNIKTDKKILNFSLIIVIFNFLYISNDTFFYCFLIIIALYFFVKSYHFSKLIYLTSMFGFYGYIVILGTIEGDSLKLFLNDLTFIDHTWEYQFQNHFYGINIMKQCGLLGCGFGIWSPVPVGWQPTLLVTTYGGWGTEGTLFAKDVASLWIRLLKDLGILGLIIIYFIFKKLKKLMYSNIFYLRFFGAGFLVYSLSRLFHSGFYYNADLFLMIFLLIIFASHQDQDQKI